VASWWRNATGSEPQPWQPGERTDAGRRRKSCAILCRRCHASQYEREGSGYCQLSALMSLLFTESGEEMLFFRAFYQRMCIASPIILPHGSFVSPAVKPSWLHLLLTGWARRWSVNDFFLPLVLQGIQQGGSYLPHPAARAYGFARADSALERDAATPGRYLRCSVRDWQPERRVICSHSPAKGSVWVRQHRVLAEDAERDCTLCDIIFCDYKEYIVTEKEND
jgi:hypothetical protein